LCIIICNLVERLLFKIPRIRRSYLRSLRIQSRLPLHITIISLKRLPEITFRLVKQNLDFIKQLEFRRVNNQITGLTKSFLNVIRPNRKNIRLRIIKARMRSYKNQQKQLAWRNWKIRPLRIYDSRRCDTSLRVVKIWFYMLTIV
jgi:hypothetical protein